MIGRTLGHYRVLEKIGAGGMGVVYRAADTRLGREVAIKVLPDAFAADPNRLARFEREAHVLASLNHPNIAAIYGLEESDGVRYLVLELVPGLTLAEELAAGPLALPQALSICRQVAEALETAHERGVIHRDLKPANVKTTPEGRVKVLDFGLAKAFAGEGAAEDITKSPTVSVGGTHSGVVLGTAPYMSPEQARGKSLDRRTDIWSFGCLLYELLAGGPAFHGESVSDVIVEILEREPDWRRLPGRTPHAVGELLRRCLQKDLHRRLQHIGDARVLIEEVLAVPSSEWATTGGDLPAVQTPLRARPLLAVALGSLLLGAVSAWLALRQTGGPESATQVAEVSRLTHETGLSEGPTWSPDGSLLAFASNRSGNFEIYVRRVQGGQEVNVTNDPGEDFQPSFSPDGNWLAFISTRSSRSGLIRIGATFGLEFRTYGGDLWMVPALGGQARRLAREANFPAWHPNGRTVFYVTGPEDHRAIFEVAAEGGTPKALLASSSSNFEIVRLQSSPRGTWISLETVDGSVYVLSPDGGEPRKLHRGTSHVWDPAGGRIFYLSRDTTGGTRMQAVGVDEARGEIRGQPMTVGLVTGMILNLAVSRDGRQFAVSQFEGSLNLSRLPLGPDGGAPAGPEEELNSGQVIDRYPAFSPDGQRVAFASDRIRPMEIWILDLGTRRLERLQLPGEDLGANMPDWSPDGKQILVTRFFPEGARAIWLAATDGSYAEQLRPPRPGFVAGRFSPDGGQVLYFSSTGGFNQMFLLDLKTRQERQLTSSAGDKYDPAWSPDGRWVAYTSNAGNSMQLWRVSVADGKEEQLTTGHERMRHTFFSPDGRWLYIQPSHGNVHRLPAAGGALQPVTRFPESGLFVEEPALSSDGRYLVYCRSKGGSSLWLLKIKSGG